MSTAAPSPPDLAAGCLWALGVGLLTAAARMACDPGTWVGARSDLPLSHASFLGCALPLAIAFLSQIPDRRARLTLAALILFLPGGDVVLGATLCALVLSCGTPGRRPFLGAALAAVAAIPGGLSAAAMDAPPRTPDLVVTCLTAASATLLIAGLTGRVMPDEPDRPTRWRFDPIGLFVGAALLAMVHLKVPHDYRIPATLAAVLVTLRTSVRSLSDEEPAP